MLKGLQRHRELCTPCFQVVSFSLRFQVQVNGPERQTPRIATANVCWVCHLNEFFYACELLESGVGTRWHEFKRGEGCRLRHPVFAAK